MAKPAVLTTVNSQVYAEDGGAQPRDSPTFSRTDSELFQTEVFGKASAIKFLKGRVRFLKPDGKEAGSPGCGSVLIAYGDEDANILEVNELEGKFIRL